MTNKEKDDILNKIEWEGGYEAAFISYGLRSKDKKCQELIDNFVNAYNELQNFLTR